MAFCSKCGTQLGEGAAFCPQCGQPVQPVSEVVIEPTFDQNDIYQNKAMAILSYIGLLFLVPLLAAKHSPYAQFHAKQGANLCILSAIAATGISILSAIFSGVVVLNVLVWMTSFAVYSGTIAFTVIGIIYAAKGMGKQLPIVGSIQFIR